MKMPISATSFSVSEAARRRIACRHAGMRGLGLPPAVAEGLVVIDFAELGIDGAELVSNSLDARADIRSVAIFAAPGNETDVVHAIIHRAVSHVAADIGGEQMHDLELGQG